MTPDYASLCHTPRGSAGNFFTLPGAPRGMQGSNPRPPHLPVLTRVSARQCIKVRPTRTAMPGGRPRAWHCTGLARVAPRAGPARVMARATGPRASTRVSPRECVTTMPHAHIVTHASTHAKYAHTSSWCIVHVGPTGGERPYVQQICIFAFLQKSAQNCPKVPRIHVVRVYNLKNMFYNINVNKNKF